MADAIGDILPTSVLLRVVAHAIKVTPCIFNHVRVIGVDPTSASFPTTATT